MFKRNENNSSPTGDILQISVVLQSLALTIILFLLCAFILSFFVYFSTWQLEAKLLRLLTRLCILLGGLWSGRSCRRRAWLHGMFVGMIAYFLLLWLNGTSNLLFTFLWWKNLFSLAFIGLVGGILGGLINNKNRF